MTGLIILAAGNSSRLGRPKQNLVFGDKTLLQHAVGAAVQSGCAPVILVLGANVESIVLPPADTGITIVHNANWQQGMATSIRAGITELQKTNGVDSVILMLCDQPFADAALIDSMVKQHSLSRKGIVACAYPGTVGVPVLFAQAYFSDLLKLNGHEGAKKLLGMYADEVAVVNFAKGSIDIDTMADYEGLAG